MATVNKICAVQQQLLSGSSNGYSVPLIQCSADDVVLASGCSDALNMALCALLNAGDNVLIPRQVAESFRFPS